MLKFVKILLANLCFIIAFNTTCMLEPLPLARINRWTEIEPYVGKIIAYKATLYYLKGDPFVISNCQNLCYGYIRSVPQFYGSGRGYFMQRLLKKEFIPDDCTI